MTCGLLLWEEERCRDPWPHTAAQGCLANWGGSTHPRTHTGASSEPAEHLAPFCCLPCPNTHSHPHPTPPALLQQGAGPEREGQNQGQGPLRGRLFLKEREERKWRRRRTARQRGDGDTSGARNGAPLGQGVAWRGRHFVKRPAATFAWSPVRPAARCNLHTQLMMLADTSTRKEEGKARPRRRLVAASGHDNNAPRKLADTFKRIPGWKKHRWVRRLGWCPVLHGRLGADRGQA